MEVLRRERRERRERGEDGGGEMRMSCQHGEKKTEGGKAA